MICTLADSDDAEEIMKIIISSFSGFRGRDTQTGMSLLSFSFFNNLKRAWMFQPELRNREIVQKFFLNKFRQKIEKYSYNIIIFPRDMVLTN